MIERDTVLILGAGASMPYGFPSGREMLLQICNKIKNRDDDFFSLHSRVDGIDWEELQEFGRKLRRSQLPSVDKFLELNNEYLRIGKFCISVNLIPYESRDIAARGDNYEWYEYLFSRLIDGVQDREEITANNLRVITFNYDRSIDFYIFEAIRHTFQVDASSAAGISRSIPILHVHGMLGELWEKEGEGRKYVEELNPDAVEEAMEGIRIMSETDDYVEERYHTARSYLRDADVVCFLGFGYHRDNLERLRISGVFGDEINEWPALYGTGKGLGEREVIHIRNMFREWAPSGGSRFEPSPGTTNLDLLQDEVHLS